MPLVSGATAAGFSIVRQVEFGEFGELYVAEHPRLPRLQLLQLIPGEISADLDYRQDFLQESDLAASLWHPNIVGITDRGEHDGQLWISTDYIDGVDAATMLGDSHPDGMRPKMVIEIVTAIADALDYAHDQGVLHRYVNPGVILVSNSPSDQRRIALTGFGVARPVGDTNNTLTRANLFIGTASYAAPEQLLGDTVDGRTDQYALAGSAFHLLTGTPPFAHFNPTVTIAKHLNDRPPRPSDVRPDLTDFDAIFARALSQDPVDRFRRCRDFAKALQSTGGTRSHIRGAAILQDTPDAATAIVPAAPDVAAAPDVEAATEAAPAIKPAAPPEPAPPAALVEPAAEVDDDGDHNEANRRRLQHTAALAGVIVVVVAAWFLGVRALRTASQSDDTPTNADTTTSADASTPAAPVPPVMATLPSGVLAPPPAPSPPPVTTTRSVVTATTPTTTTRSAAPPTTATQTTRPHTTPSTTTPSGLDTRPAVGMPCGPDQTGAAAVSNSGGPVNCVSTPGGFAWEPPGVQPAG